MKNVEIEEMCRAADRCIKKFSKTKKMSKQALVGSGIYDKWGNLLSPYNGESSKS